MVKTLKERLEEERKKIQEGTTQTYGGLKPIISEPEVKKTLREKVGEFSSSIQKAGKDFSFTKTVKGTQKAINPFEEENRFNPAVKRFQNAFGENVSKSIERTKDIYNEGNKSTTDTLISGYKAIKNKDVPSFFNTVKDAKIRKANSVLAYGTTSIDAILGSTVGGAFSALAGEGGIEEDSGISKVLQALDTGYKIAGEGYKSGVNLGLTKKLSTKEEEIAKFTGGEILTDLALGGAGKLIIKTPSLISKGFRKIGDVTFTKNELVKSTKDLNSNLDRLDAEFDKNNFDEVTTVKLQELTERIGKGNISVAEIHKISKEIGLNPEMYVSKLKEITSNQYYKGKATAKLYDKMKSKISPAIRKSIDELGYEGAVVKHGKRQIDNTLNQIKNEGLNISPDAQTIQILFEQAQLKGLGGKEFLDTPENAIKGINLKNAVDAGLMEHIVGGGKKEGLDSFRWTKKGLDVIEKEIDMKPFQATYTRGNLLANHIAEGASDYPTAFFKKVSDDVDSKKAIPSSVVKQMFEDLTKRDYSLTQLDGLDFLNKAGDDIDLNKTFDLFTDMNSKYNLKLDKEIEGIINGGKEALDDLFEKFNELKKNEFVTVDNIKNPGKNLNIDTRIGFTDKVFATLKKGVEKLAEGDLNKRIKTLETKINKARIAIKKQYAGDAISLKIREKALVLEHQAEMLALKAKHEGITSVKGALRKNLNELKKSNIFKGDTLKVIDKFLNRSNWTKLQTAGQLETKVKQLYKNIEVQHTAGLIREIRDGLKGFNQTKKSRTSKTKTMTAEQVIQLETAKEIFGRIRKGELDMTDLQTLLDEINEIKAKGTASKRLADKEYSLRINNDLSEIKESLKDKYLKGWANTVNKDSSEKTFMQKAMDAGKSWDNKTLFGERLIEKIFGKGTKAYNYFYTKVVENYNAFESFEQLYTDVLAKNIGKIFNNNLKQLREYGTYLYARRRLYDKDGNAIWIGIDRIRYDKTSVWKNKTTKYMDEPKPDYLADMKAELWDEIKETELAGILLKHNTPAFKEATNSWDKYHSVTGKMLKATALKNGNKIVDIDDYYISFQARKGPSKDIDSDIGSADFHNTHLSTSTLKAVNKEMMDGKFIWDYNPISVLYGNGRKSRYYSFMKETHKDITSLFNGNAKSIKELNIDEFNDVIDNQKSYTITVDNTSVEILGSKVIEGENFIEYKSPKTEVSQLASLDAIKVKGNGIGLNDTLSQEAIRRLDAYITRIGNGGNMVKSQIEKNFALASNHFNRLPLKGSLSVVAKQPLALIDGAGLIGFKNMARAEADLWNVKDIDIYLHKVPSIMNRGGGDFLIKELKNFTTGSEWADQMVKKYNGYTELAMAPIKMADMFAYKRIWLGAYRDYLVKNGLMKPDVRIDINHLKNINDPGMADAVAYADSLANKASSTANPLMMPEIYNNVATKALFGIFTTQLNRIQLLTHDMPELWKNGEYRRASVLTASLMTSNIFEAFITYQVGKLMNTIGVTDYEMYEQDISELMLSFDTGYRITAGQFFFPSKWEGINNPNFGVTPMFGGLGKLHKNIQENIKLFDEGDLSISSVLDIPVSLFGGKILEQIKGFIDNQNE